MKKRVFSDFGDVLIFFIFRVYGCTQKIFGKNEFKTVKIEVLKSNRLLYDSFSSCNSTKYR